MPFFFFASSGKVKKQWIWNFCMKTTDQSAGIGGVWGVILEEAGQAKVRHFAHQVAVDQDVSSCQVSMDIIHVTQILHSCCYATQHSHQLDHCKLPVILLQEKQNSNINVCLLWWMNDDCEQDCIVKAFLQINHIYACWVIISKGLKSIFMLACPIWTLSETFTWTALYSTLYWQN